jgi:hypothetical protein
MAEVAAHCSELRREPEIANRTAVKAVTFNRARHG